MDIFLLYSDWALLALRVVLGALLMAHGIPKLQNWKGTVEWFQSIGFKPGWFFGTWAGILETFGGLFLIIGWLMRPVAILLVAQFIVILGWRIKSKHKFVGGWELDILILAAVLVLLTVGGGVWTL